MIMSEDYKWRYGFFLGCVIPNRYPMIEASIRNVFDHLGAEILDLPGASCCPAPGVFRAFHIPTWLVIAARNISIAEEIGVNPLTGCNGCYGTLRDAWYELEHEYELKKQVNEYLAKVGRTYKGHLEPKHVVQALYLDMGLDYLKDFIKLKFSDLKVAVHYGCHIVKEVAADFTREKLVNMREAGVDVIVNCCPFCHLQLDLGQMEVNNIFKDEIGELFHIPVIYITQLLGVAFGMDPNLLGLVKNHELQGVSPFISIDPFLNIVKEQLI